MLGISQNCYDSEEPNLGVLPAKSRHRINSPTSAVLAAATKHKTQLASDSTVLEMGMVLSLAVTTSYSENLTSLTFRVAAKEGFLGWLLLCIPSFQLASARERWGPDQVLLTPSHFSDQLIFVTF